MSFGEMWCLNLMDHRMLYRWSMIHIVAWMHFESHTGLDGRMVVDKNIYGHLGRVMIE